MALSYHLFNSQSWSETRNLLQYNLDLENLSWIWKLLLMLLRQRLIWVQHWFKIRVATLRGVKAIILCVAQKCEFLQIHLHLRWLINVGCLRRSSSPGFQACLPILESLTCSQGFLEPPQLNKTPRRSIKTFNFKNICSKFVTTFISMLLKNIVQASWAPILNLF